MEMKFDRIFGDRPIEVNAKNVGNILRAIISDGAQSKQGYHVGQTAVAQLAEAAKANGFAEPFNTAAAALLTTYASGLGNNMGGRSMPDIARDSAYEKILLGGLVQGRAPLGTMVTPEYAWRRMGEWTVPAIANAFQGYPEHINMATTKSEAEKYGAAFIAAVVFRERQGQPADINVLAPLEATRRKLPRELGLALEDGISRQAAEAVRTSGSYGVERVEALAKQSPLFARALHDGIAWGEHSRRHMLDQVRQQSGMADVQMVPQPA